MRNLLIAGAMALATASTGTIAFADHAPKEQPRCEQKSKDCRKPLNEKPRKGAERHDRAAPHSPRGPEKFARNDNDGAPRIGGSGRHGKAVKPGADMKPAPRGQEYRVLDGRLVLVEKKSHRIVSVLGPAETRR